MTDDKLFQDDGRIPAGGEHPTRRLRDRWLLISIAGVLALLLIAGGAFALLYGKPTQDAMDSIQRDPSVMPTNTDRPQPAPGDGDTPLNIALMVTSGNDGGEPEASDVVKLMLMHVTGDRETAYLVSMPADYWVDVPGHGPSKIVEAYAKGGPALTVQTVEQLVNVPVDHTAIVQLEGMINVIDTIGGVTVTNKHASESNGFSYPEGEVTLSGDSALNFVQGGEQLPNGDAVKAERQQDVLNAIAGKLISRGVLANPTMFGDAVTILGPNLTVDTELDNDTIVSLGTSMRISGGDDVKAVMAPSLPADASKTEEPARTEVDDAKLAELQKALSTDSMDEYFTANN